MGTLTGPPLVKVDKATALNKLYEESQGYNLEWKLGCAPPGAFLQDGTRDFAYRPCDHYLVTPYLRGAQKAVELLHTANSKYKFVKVLEDHERERHDEVERQFHVAEGLLNAHLKTLQPLATQASKVVSQSVLPRVPSWSEWLVATREDDPTKLLRCGCGARGCKRGAGCKLLFDKAKAHPEPEAFLRAVLLAEGGFQHPRLRYLNPLSGQTGRLAPTEPLPKPLEVVARKKRKFTVPCLLDRYGAGCPFTLKGLECAGGRRCQKLHAGLWAQAELNRERLFPEEQLAKGLPTVRLVGKQGGSKADMVLKHDLHLKAKALRQSRGLLRKAVAQKPKRPLTAYLLFLQHRFSGQHLPTSGAAAGAAWKALPPEERAHYQEAAAVKSSEWHATLKKNTS